MDKPLFYGVCTAMVTPFINGHINYPMMQVLLRRQIDAGIPAAVICGTTGEAPTLSDEEKVELLKKCKEYAGNQLCIIAGTGSNSTKHAIELSVKAQEAGADALLVVSPYYNKATPEGLIAHYAAIANAVKIPIILYNVPTRTGLDIPVSVYKRLSGIRNIIGVKEASTSIEKILQIRVECPNDFIVWAGNDDMTVPVISLGGKGVISVVSNLIPEELQAMALAALDGDLDTASTLQCQIAPLTKLLSCEVNPIPIKAAMNLAGYDCGRCRLPLTPLSADNERKLKEFLC